MSWAVMTVADVVTWESGVSVRVEVTNTGGSVASGGSAARKPAAGSAQKSKMRTKTLMETSFTRERGYVAATRIGLLARASNLLAAPSRPRNFRFWILDWDPRSLARKSKIGEAVASCGFRSSYSCGAAEAFPPHPSTLRQFAILDFGFLIESKIGNLQSKIGRVGLSGGRVTSFPGIRVRLIRSAV